MSLFSLYVMIYVPHHTKNAKIHDDIRNKPGNRVVVLRKKRHIFSARVRRYLFSKTVLSTLTIISIVLMSSNIHKLKADEVIFYPNACLGGFDSPKLAEHKPETDVDASKGDFDIENSALLPKIKNAELYCGNFDGDVDEGTVPKTITLTIHMAAKSVSEVKKIDGDSAEKAVTEALDGVSTKDVIVDGKQDPSSAEVKNSHGEPLPSETSETEATPLSDPTKEDTPKTEEDTPKTEQTGEPDVHASLPQSLLRVFVHTVRAEDESPAPVIDTPPSDNASALQVDVAAPVTSPEISETKNQESPQEVITDSSSSVTVLEAVHDDQRSQHEEKTSESSQEEKVTEEKTEEKTSILGSLFSNKEDAAPLLQSTSSANAAFEIKFSTGGDEWTSLALLSNADVKTVSLSLPYTPASWKDLSTFQIMVKSLENFDERDDLYVDGMELHISYGPKDGVEKEEMREYHASHVENKEDGYIVSLSGTKGERQFLSLWAKEQVGVAVYSLDSDQMVMSTSVNDATSTIDPNGSIPEYGSFAVIFTQDSNWCNGKSLSLCAGDKSSVALSYFSLFASAKKEEGKSVLEKKTKVGKIFSDGHNEETASSTPSTATLLDQKGEVIDTQEKKEVSAFQKDERLEEVKKTDE